MMTQIGKTITLVFLALLVNLHSEAQRASPPATTDATIGDISIEINYSQPSAKGRDIWGGLVPFGKVWRTGANEATTFETSGDLMVGDQKLPAGKYGLYTVPGKDSFTFIFSSVWDTWGTNYSESNDVLRVNGTFASGEQTEKFTISIADDMLHLAWDDGVGSIQLSEK